MTCSKTSENLEKVWDCLKKGGICILPTDTVYGFSGIVDIKGSPEYETDALIRRIKGRDESKPLIQLIARPEDIFLYTDDQIPEKVMKNWPGPLTVIVNVKKESPLAHSVSTVAFRCPGDQWLRKLIEKCGCPLFSTSVNRSGKPVLDEIDAIVKEFESETNLIVEDGDKKGSLPSTIVSVQKNEHGKSEVKVLRQGAVVID